MSQHLLIAGAGSCIVSCMDEGEFRELYPYRVLAEVLTTDEVRDLSRHLVPDETCELGKAWTADKVEKFFDWLRRETHDDSLKHSTVLLPIAGAVGKAGLDVLVDRVKEWLENRPGGRTVEIFGPDNQVVRIVKTGKGIRTSSAKRSSGKRSKDPNLVSVIAVDLTADERRDLRRHLGLKDTASRGIYNRLGVPLTKVLLVPFAGAIIKKAVDVLVDRVAKWLVERFEERPGDRRNVKITLCGPPDNQFQRIIEI